MQIPQLQSLLKRNAQDIAQNERTIRDYQQMIKDGTFPKLYAPFVYNRISRFRDKVKKLANLQVAIKKDIKREQQIINRDRYANHLLDILGIV